MFARTTVLVTVLGVLTVVSAQTLKQPWALTLDERIARRSDPRAAQDRAVQANTAGFMNVADAFTGRTHRELFMPTQIFDMLMQNAYVVGSEEQAAAFRRSQMGDAMQQGLPAHFWSRLEIVTAPYIADARAVHGLGRSLANLDRTERKRVRDELEILQRDACGSRADALAAARREFGAERFDRFLYGAIASNMFHAADQVPRAAQLRWIENGCR